MGVATGCGCKDVYRFPILLISTPLVSVLFCSTSLLFVHFFMFFVLYNLKIAISHSFDTFNIRYIYIR